MSHLRNPRHPLALTLADLWRGREVYFHSPTGPELLTVTSSPFYRGDGPDKVHSIRAKTGKGVEKPYSLADLGVVPYPPNNAWNTTNYVTAA